MPSIKKAFNKFLNIETTDKNSEITEKIHNLIKKDFENEVVFKKVKTRKVHFCAICNFEISKKEIVYVMKNKKYMSWTKYDENIIQTIYFHHLCLNKLNENDIYELAHKIIDGYSIEPKLIIGRN